MLSVTVPFIISSRETLSLIGVANAEFILPSVLYAVPLHRFAFRHALLVVILVAVLHVVCQSTTIHLVNGLSYHYAVFLFRIVNKVVLVGCESRNATEQDYC